MPDDRFIHRKAGHSDKVNKLTSDEYRTWTQYILSADDFGVMRGSAVTLQADNDFLASKPPKAVQRWLDAVLESGLILAFDHQKRRYVFQHDWQTWQKITYPRSTNQPVPPAAALALCDAATQKLFAMHPGGAGKKRPERLPNIPETFQEDSKNIPETFSEDSPLMRASAPAKRLTANGQRLTANGSEGGAGETDPPYAQWLKDLTAEYPPENITSGYATETAFIEEFRKDGRVPAAVYSEMRLNLATQIAGERWSKGHIPNLDGWLRDGKWKQKHAPAAQGATSSKTAGNVAALQRFANRGQS